MSKRPSLRKAIDRHCRDCIFDPYSRGKWRQQVLECASPNCALFEVRPAPTATLPKGEARKSILRVEIGRNSPFPNTSGGGS